LAGKGSVSRFVWVIVCIAGTMFLLQETNLVDGHSVDGRLLVIVAVALGAAFAMAHMIQRVAKKATVPPEKAERAR
jgi:threonine/homoserine efflux transporter RhtA